MCFLADEGIRGYGTLFGSLIGSTVGQATSQSGATVIGPTTMAASDKVTLHHQPGLYGFSAPIDGTTSVGGTSDCWKNGITMTTLQATNTELVAGENSENGKWSGATSGEQVHCVMIGKTNDDSLVSTTNAAAERQLLFNNIQYITPALLVTKRQLNLKEENKNE